jgi:predicted DNA-binding transcriptional regulator YafY
MANTSSRTLRLLSLLQTHRYWSGDELAGRLDVSVRTLRRDVDRLRDLGYPVQADRGIGGGYQLAPGASLPPLVLDDAEAVALAVGLQSAANSTLTGIAEASVSALAKVVQVMPRTLRRQVEAVGSVSSTPAWGQQPATDPSVLVVIAQSCRDDERVTFDYVAADKSSSSRRVEPAQLVAVGHRWYLVGYDLDRGDWRSFRLDRMEKAAATGTRFRQRQLPGGDAVAYVQERLRHAALNVRASAELAGDADSIRERIGQWAEVTALDDKRCRVEMNAESLEWAVFAIGASGAQIINAEPADFADRLADWSHRLGAKEQNS